MKRLSLLVLLCCSLVHAEDLAPELAPLAQTQKLQSNTLAEQKQQAIAAAQKAYLNTLNAADQTATSAGNVATLTAIAKDRQLVTKGGMGETFPSDLPKTLGPARKAYLRELERIDTTIGARQKQLNADYLRSLATLQGKAAANPKLAEQIASEKIRVLSGITGPLTDVTKGLEGTRWRKITPGDGQSEWSFSGGKVNRTWVYETTPPDQIRVIWNDRRSTTVTLGKDGKTLLQHGKPVWELLTAPAGQ